MSEPRMEPGAGADETHLERAENRQLKETIVALHDKLESMGSEKEQCVQQAVAAANDEIAQLKATVTALRDKLERSSFTYEDTMQERERVSRDECNQLQQTIVALRKRIEEGDAK